MLYLVTSILSVLVCITIHEAAHAYMAYKLGVDTASVNGRMTLNPFSHIDPIGFIALVFFHFGWAKPVPVNYRKLKNPKRDGALIALAGPVSNFLLALILYVFSTIALSLNNQLGYAIMQFFNMTAMMSVGLGVFNLIPIPPLDGSHILMPLLPQKSRVFMVKNEQIIQFTMILCLYFGVFNRPLYFLREKVTEFLFIFVDLITFFLK